MASRLDFHLDRVLAKHNAIQASAATAEALFLPSLFRRQKHGKLAKVRRQMEIQILLQVVAMAVHHKDGTLIGHLGRIMNR